jgi:hypothetical protein
MRLLPARELGCASPSTVWRPLDEWARVGVFEQLHMEILDRLRLAGRLACALTCLDRFWGALRGFR